MNDPIAFFHRMTWKRLSLNCEKHAEIVCKCAENHAEALLALTIGPADNLLRKPAGRACLCKKKASCERIMQNGTIPSNLDRYRYAKFSSITSLLAES